MALPGRWPRQRGRRRCAYVVAEPRTGSHGEADRRRAHWPVFLARAELNREADRGRARSPVPVRNC